MCSSDLGFRHMTNNKRPINNAHDAAGLKMRTMENKVHMTGYKTFGLLPTPMAFPELFGALGYLAPEQVDPKEPRPEPTPLSDQFALAVIAFGKTRVSRKPHNDLVQRHGSLLSCLRATTCLPGLF